MPVTIEPEITKGSASVVIHIEASKVRLITVCLIAERLITVHLRSICGFPGQLDLVLSGTTF